MRGGGIFRSFGRDAIAAWRGNVLPALPHFTLAHGQEPANWQPSSKPDFYFKLLRAITVDII